MPTMRKTRATLDIARALVDEPDRQCWAYELAGRLHMSTGAAHIILKRMTEYGWLADHWEPSETAFSRPRRHYYRLTELGKQMIPNLLGWKRDEISIDSVIDVNCIQDEIAS